MTDSTHAQDIEHTGKVIIATDLIRVADTHRCGCNDHGAELSPIEDAYHEGGHVVAAFRRGRGIIGASIEPEPNGRYRGCSVLAEPRQEFVEAYKSGDPLSEEHKQVLETLAIGLLAGVMVEQVTNPDLDIDRFAYSDWQGAIDLVRRIASDNEQAEAYFEQLRSEAQRLVTDQTGAALVKIVADALSVFTTVDGAFLERVLQANGDGLTDCCGGESYFC